MWPRSVNTNEYDSPQVIKSDRNAPEVLWDKLVELPKEIEF